jgi:hypothetical protein
VISYYDETNGALKVAHCNDLDCAGGDDSINTVDDTSNRGQYSSLVLDSVDNPIISYYDDVTGKLFVATCNDVDCADGDDAPSGPVNTGEGTDNVGQYSSLALNLFDEKPTIAYYNMNDGLKLVHCTNQDCSGSQSSALVDPAGPVSGTSLSMAIDSSSNPAIAYYDGALGGLAIARCDDPDCSTAVTTTPVFGFTDPIDASIAVDANDLAVVSYVDNLTGPDQFVRVLRCNDLTCSSPDVETPDPVAGEMPYNTSIAVDIYGNPIISRFSSTSNSIIVVRCTNPTCVPRVKVLSAP